MSHVHQGRNHDAGNPDRSAPHSRRRALRIVAGCLLAALILSVAYPLVIHPKLAGDGGEYLLTLQAWFDHGSPDLRPADIEAMDRITPSERPFSTLVKPWAGFVKAPNGRWYGMHFWLYPLLGVPAKLVLRIAGGSEFAALQTTNVICFVAAVCFTFFHGNPHRPRRLLFLALSATGPVLWFLRWPHPEVFTWCCALVSLTLLGRKRYGLSAMAAAVGALQNPPLILLAILPAALATSRRQWRRAVVAAVCTAPAFIAPLFCLYHFQTPSLISSVGGVNFAHISLSRSWSFFTDLNQGMLPYIPALVLFGLAGAVLALAGRRLTGIGVASVLAGMILIIQSAPNWNHGTAGMTRYAVWMMPLFAWLAAEYLPFKQRWLRLLLVAGLLLQAGIVFSHSGKPDYLVQQSWTRAVLSIFPRWYNPDPEIFVERQMGDEESWLGRLPVGFISSDGSITKVLAERRSVERFAHHFGLEGKLAPEITRLRHPVDLVYLHPPRGAVKVVEPLGWGAQALESGIHWEPVNLPGAILDPELRFHLEVTNRARYRFWGVSSGASHPLTFVCRLFENGEQIDINTIHAPFFLSSGKTVLLPVKTELPRRTGTFRVEVQGALKHLVWDERQAGIEVQVLGVDESSYLAKIILEEGEPLSPDN